MAQRLREGVVSLLNFLKKKRNCVSPGLKNRCGYCIIIIYYLELKIIETFWFVFFMEGHVYLDSYLKD